MQVTKKHINSIQVAHTNSIRIVFEKDNDRKIYYLFHGGIARDMTNGFGELVKYCDVCRQMKADGYKEICR